MMVYLGHVRPSQSIRKSSLFFPPWKQKRSGLEDPAPGESKTISSQNDGPCAIIGHLANIPLPTIQLFFTTSYRRAPALRPVFVSKDSRDHGLGSEIGPRLEVRELRSGSRSGAEGAPPVFSGEVSGSATRRTRKYLNPPLRFPFLARPVSYPGWEGQALKGARAMGNLRKRESGYRYNLGPEDLAQRTGPEEKTRRIRKFFFMD